MPPQPPDRPYAVRKQRAVEIFVDREEPKAAFTAAVESLAEESAKPQLLVFYGVGGQGKTALCRELIRLCRAEPLVAIGAAPAPIDLHLNRPQGYWHALVQIRNALAGAIGADFPCFDLAFADWWSQARPELPPAVLGAHRLAALTEVGIEAASDAVKSIGDEIVKAATEGWVEAAAEMVGGVPFIGPILKRSSRWAFQKGYERLVLRNRAALEGLYEADNSPSVAAIEAALPDILAHELGLALRRRRKRLPVLMIDEYESALPSGGSLGLLYQDPWDRAVRDFFSACYHGKYAPEREGADYAYEAGFLLVIFGRERLRWDEISDGWLSDLSERQHLLEGLGREDADLFLRKAGIADKAVRSAMILASIAREPGTGQSMVYPLLLDISSQIFFDLRAAGRAPQSDDFQCTGVSYVERRRSLFERFMRNYRDMPGLGELLRRLACAREFDRDVTWSLVRSFGIAFDMSHLIDVQGLSFVGEAEDRQAFVLHAHMADTLREMLSEEDRRETDSAFCDYFLDRAANTSGELRIEAACDAIGHASLCGRCAEVIGRVDYLELGQARFAPIVETSLARVLDTLRVRSVQDPLARTQVAMLVAQSLGLQGRQAEAESIHRRELEAAHSRTPDGYERMLYLRGLGVALMEQGRLSEAEAAFREGLSTSVNRSDLHCEASLSSGLAQVLELTGRFTEAEVLHRRAVELIPAFDGRGESFLNIQADLKFGLAANLQAQGGLAEAEPLLRWALQAFEQEVGETHQNTCKALRTLAENLTRQSRYIEAAPLHHLSVDRSRAALGSDHLLTASALNGLADQCDQQDEIAEAEAARREAYQIYERALGANHPATIQAASALAATLDLAGRLAQDHEAIAAAYLEAGQLNPSGLFAVYVNYAVNEAARGRYSKAQNLLARLLGLFQALGPAKGLEVWMIQWRLAAAMLETGRPEEAQALLLSAMNGLEHLLGDRHAWFGLLVSDNAVHLDRHGTHELAEVLHRRSLQILTDCHGPDHARPAAAESALAACLDRQGRTDEAGPMHRHAVPLLESALGPTNPRIAPALGALARHLDLIGRHGAASPLHNRAIAVLEAAVERGEGRLRDRLLDYAEHLKASGQIGQMAVVLKRARLPPSG